MANVWFYWTGDTSSANYTTATSATTWTYWATENVTSASSAWVMWTSAGDATSDYTLQPIVDERTDEQKAADEARWQAERERVAAAAKQAEDARKAARDKARALLVSMLNEKQREQLQREMFFEIVSQSQKRYRIRQGTHGNVRLLDAGGKEVTRYCGQPNGVPDEDAMLAQKLQLEYDEASFLRLANATRM